MIHLPVTGARKEVFFLSKQKDERQRKPKATKQTDKQTNKTTTHKYMYAYETDGRRVCGACGEYRVICVVCNLSSAASFKATTASLFIVSFLRMLVCLIYSFVWTLKNRS